MLSHFPVAMSDALSPTSSTSNDAPADAVDRKKKNADAQAAFEPLTPVHFNLDRLETNPRFATIARPANAAILVKLRIDMEERGGNIELLLPYATIEPIRNVLLQMFMGEKFGRDPIWEGHFATEVAQQAGRA